MVTAGPTREPIDPVRFISNCATGFLGYELAKEVKKRGHRVILISGPTFLAKPKNISLIDVTTARQMSQELNRRLNWCDCLIMTAAICDFRAKKVAGRKIKRSRNKELALKLTRTPDILAGLGRSRAKMVRQGKVLVGFALETENLKSNAQDKLRQKNLDLIVATHMKARSYPFGPVGIETLIIDRKGRIQKISKTSKAHLCRILLDRIEKIVLQSKFN